MTEWLLMKRGLYYRPDECGYTGIRDHAGRYTEEHARRRCGSEVTMVRLDEAPEITSACFDDLARDHLTKQRDAARDEIDRLQTAKRAALKIADERSKENAALRQEIERLRADLNSTPTPEKILLQARAPEGGEWINIFPAQLSWIAKNGLDVRALETADPVPNGDRDA